METKQDCSLSDPGSDNPAYEMEPIVVNKVGITANDNAEIPSEQQKCPLDNEQGLAEEKEVLKVDLSKQEEPASDIQEEQPQADLCLGDAHPKGSQYLQDEDGKNYSHSRGNCSKIKQQ